MCTIYSTCINSAAAFVTSILHMHLVLEFGTKSVALTQASLLPSSSLHMNRADNDGGSTALVCQQSVLRKMVVSSAPQTMESIGSWSSIFEAICGRPRVTAERYLCNNTIPDCLLDGTTHSYAKDVFLTSLNGYSCTIYVPRSSRSPSRSFQSLIGF